VPLTGFLAPGTALPVTVARLRRIYTGLPASAARYEVIWTIAEVPQANNPLRGVPGPSFKTLAIIYRRFRAQRFEVMASVDGDKLIAFRTQMQ
jgi:hypothetical protein